MADPRSFRFGVNTMLPQGRAEFVDKVRKAEDLGYDVVGVADHLGMPPPFPALVLAAEATERIRLNTFVLNVPFYNPVLLAREVAGTDQFTEGRLELGLGAGYVKAEFEAAGVPFGTGATRVDHLEHTIRELKRLFADPEFQPKPRQQPGPPLLLGGRGNRLLRLAAEHADVVAFTGAAAGKDGEPMRAATSGELAERVDFAKAALGPRAGQVELNLLIQRVVRDKQPLLEAMREHVPDLTGEKLDDIPTFLAGTPRDVADQLLALRDRYGFTYLTVLEDSMDEFAEAIALLR